MRIAAEEYSLDDFGDRFLAEAVEPLLDPQNHARVGQGENKVPAIFISRW